MRAGARSRSGGRWLVLPFLLVPAIVALLGLLLLVMTSADMSETLGVPRSVDRLLQRDGVAYPAHATMASVFEVLGLPPEVTALQWVKAAYHAQSEDRLDRAVRGLEAAIARDGDGARVREAVCPVAVSKRDIGAARVARAVARSGLRCPGSP